MCLKNYLLFIFQIFNSVNKNEAGECLISHVGDSLRSLGSEDQVGGACERRAAAAEGGCLRREGGLVGTDLAGAPAVGRHGSCRVRMHGCRV